MLRIRILSLLALMLAVMGLNYGYDSFVAMPVARGAQNPWLLVYLVLIYVGGLSIISSIAIFFLSFFAVEQDSDGSVVILKYSLYGSVFLKMVKLSPWKEYGFCGIFWLTNTFLFVVSCVSGILGFIGYVMWLDFNWEGFKMVALFFAIGLAIVAALAWIGFLSFKAFKVLTRTRFGIFYDKLCPRIKIR